MPLPYKYKLIKDNPVYNDAWHEFVINCKDQQEKGICGRPDGQGYGEGCDPVLCFQMFCKVFKLAHFNGKCNNKRRGKEHTN